VKSELTDLERLSWPLTLFDYDDYDDESKIKVQARNKAKFLCPFAKCNSTHFAII